MSYQSKQKQLTQQNRHNLHSFTVELVSIQKYKRGITWHLVLPAVCGNGLLSVSLSLSVLRCGDYVQSSASWFVQLLGCSVSLPSYNGTPLPLVQPPPVSVDGATSRQGITHNLDNHTTLSQGWRTRHYLRHLYPYHRRYGLGLKYTSFNL